MSLSVFGFVPARRQHRAMTKATIEKMRVTPGMAARLERVIMRNINEQYPHSRYFGSKL